MALTRDDLRKQLKQGEIAPVYMLFGAETHLRDLAVKTITDRAFAEGDLRDFNETNFSLNTVGNLERALAAARQLPMMSSRRVVRISDIRISATGHRDTITEDHQPLLAAYVDDPSPHSVVILIADELNGNRKMGKFLRSVGVAVEFKTLDDRELSEWARKQFRDCGAVIDENTLRFLIGRIGPDVRRLTNEINKLAAASMPSGNVSAELIEAIVPNSREANHFALTDQLMSGQRRQAIVTLRKILDDGAEPLGLLGLIGFNYRKLAISKRMMIRGDDRSRVASMSHRPYRQQEPFFAAARRTDEERLMHAIKRIAATDLAIKTSTGGSGPAAARMQLEVLVCELATL